MPRHFQASIDATEFDPFPIDADDILEGDPNPRVHWIREPENGSQSSGIFCGEPARFKYEWATDETIHILEGRLRLEFQDGRSAELNAGDVGSFAKGDSAIWHIVQPLREVFVLGT